MFFDWFVNHVETNLTEESRYGIFLLAKQEIIIIIIKRLNTVQKGVKLSVNRTAQAVCKVWVEQGRW